MSPKVIYDLLLYGFTHREVVMLNRGSTLCSNNFLYEFRNGNLYRKYIVGDLWTEVTF